MFVTLTPNLPRLIVHIPEGEVGEGTRATVGLGYDAGWADLDAPEILGGGERKHHGVTPLAHLQGLLPEELLMLHRRLVGPPVDGGL